MRGSHLNRFDGLRDLLLPSWARGSLVARILSLITVAGGVSFILGLLLAPDWTLTWALAWFPTLLGRAASALAMDVTQAALLLGAVLTVSAVVAFGLCEAWAHRHGQPIPHLQERTKVVFLTTIAFVVGFVVARAVVVYGQTLGEIAGGPGSGSLFPSLLVSGYHIHHFFYGFILLVGAAWMGLFHPGRHRRVTGVLFGLGLGIFVDEFGLLISMGDYYGSSSYVAGVTFLSLLLVALLWTVAEVRSAIEAEVGEEGGSKADLVATAPADGEGA